MASKDKIRATFDSREADLELNRLHRGMDAKTRLRMAARLEQLFQDSQQQVHILSGALQSSGRRYITDSDDYWRGTITYGGYSKKPRFVSQKKRVPRVRNAHNVDYAHVENYHHPFFTEGDMHDAFNDIQQIVADWLLKKEARNERKRARYAARRAASGQAYTPRTPR